MVGARPAADNGGTVEPAPATPKEVVRRLLDAQLITPADAVDSDVTVRNASRSNGVCLVAAGEVEYVVKGPGLAGSDGVGSLDREVRFYERISGDRMLAELAPVPRLVARLGALLVLQRARPGETLEERYRQRGPSRDDIVMLGRAVGAWRRISAAFVDLASECRTPWVLSSLETPPPPNVADNAGASRLAEAARSDSALRDGMARLREEWRRDAVIHGDVRWDNALVQLDPAGGLEQALLVDWELLDAGDSGWDVAGALADAVALEAAPPPDSRPVEAPYRRASPEEVARVSSAFNPTFLAFAEGYRGEAPPETADEDLTAGLRLLPARVLNIAFLNAAWDPAFGLSAGLELAGIAAGLLARGEAASGS